MSVAVLNANAGQTINHKKDRHGPTCSGHTGSDFKMASKKDVDARHKAGHDGPERS
jgi:hypothetical protein